MAAKKQKGSGVASMHPDNMASAGLADDFDGQITEVRVVPWDYEGNLDHHVLAVRLSIEPDEDSGFDSFTQHYSAGDLEQFVPSMDGEEPCDLDSDDEEDWEGVYALRVGRRETLNNNTNWAHFVRAALDAGLPDDEIDADVRFLEGVYGHFNRVPQQKRSGIVVDDGDGKSRVRTLLVLTEIGEAPKAAKKKSSSKKKASKKSEAADSGDDDDLDGRLVALIVEALDEADGELPKAKLPPLAVKSFKGKEKAAAVKRISDSDFLEAHEESWVFDPDEGTIYAV